MTTPARGEDQGAHPRQRPDQRHRLLLALPGRSRTRLLPAPANRSAPAATSSPRRRSASCSARCSASSWCTPGSATARPADVRLVEIGPGRGTMMADMLRVVSRLRPHSIEARPCIWSKPANGCAQIQRQTLGAHAAQAHLARQFRRAAGGLPAARRQRTVRRHPDPPVRQDADTGFASAWSALDAERRTDLRRRRRRHRSRPSAAAGTSMPHPARSSRVAPAREAVDGGASAAHSPGGGTALIIDYGHLVSGFGDTLQAVRNHAFDPPLAHPGEADLTSHVDFEPLATVAPTAACTVNGLT